jgi:TolB-like protein
MRRDLDAVHRQIERSRDPLDAVPVTRHATEYQSGATPKSHSWRQRHWREFLAIAVIAISVLAWGIQWMRRTPPVAGRDKKLEQKYVVAVMPFENLSADTTKAYVAAGLTEEITGQLSRLSALRVLSRSVVNPYRSDANRLPKMVSELGVGSVVEGSVRAEDNRAVIAVRLIDAKTGGAIWSQQYDRQLTDLFAVQSQVAKSITEALDASLTPDEARRAGRPPTVNLEAYQLYMQAWRMRAGAAPQMWAATRLLKRAIALDTTFARAYVYLGRLYLLLGSENPAYRDSGLIAVQKALVVDPDNSAAYITLGGLQSDRGHVSAGKASLLKAVALNPSSDVASLDLSVTLDVLGAYDESLLWAVRGNKLAPTNPFSYYHVAIPLLRLADDSATERFLTGAEKRFKGFPRLEIQLCALDVLRGKNSEAMERARRLVVDNPGDAEVELNLITLAAITNSADAEELLGPHAKSSPDARGMVFPESIQTLLGTVLARRGRRAQADSLWALALARAQRDVADGNEGPEPRIEIAAINAMKGNTADALTWLELGYKAGFKDPRVLAHDPHFDSVRRESRYRTVTAQMRAHITAMRRSAMAANDTLFRHR